MKTILLFPAFLIVVALCGCGDKVPLRGKVVFSDDGSPLTLGQVCFVTDGYQARGPLRSDGTYIVGSDSARNGIPPGTYRVYITGAAREILLDTRPLQSITESLIDPKFASETTSDLIAVIEPSTKRFDFSVDRAGNADSQKH